MKLAARLLNNPITFFRKRVVPKMPPSLVKFAKSAASVRMGEATSHNSRYPLTLQLAHCIDQVANISHIQCFILPTVSVSSLREDYFARPHTLKSLLQTVYSDGRLKEMVGERLVF